MAGSGLARLLRPLGLAAAVVACPVAMLSGCSSERPSSRSPKASTSTTSFGPDVALSPPGSFLAQGLVVPAGSRLIGPVFQEPLTGPGEGITKIAILQIDDDPFAVWDDIAAQARRLGAALPGSGVCRRQSPEGAVLAEYSGDEVHSLACGASAGGTSAGGRGVSINADLWWWASGAEMSVKISDTDTPIAAFMYPATDPGRAPSRAAARLPARTTGLLPDVGEAFGRNTDCFEGADSRLRVPTGARLIGGGTTPILEDFAAVLAVVDARSVLEALRSQLDDPDVPGGSYTIRSEQLPDGKAIWMLDGTANDGGGSCWMRSSPDGAAVLVTAHGD